MYRSLNISDPRINERIRVPEVRLVGPAGEQVGIVRIEDALRLATESDLDLVEVAPQAKPPVCKLMDFGKYKYEAAVKAREARKNQTNTVLKEIRFRLKIDKHDYETKKGHALRFLGAGDKVKAMIQFRGREQQRPEMGIRLLQRFAEDVAEVGSIESSPRIDGRNMVMVIGPLKNKAEAKAEARRAAQRAADKAKAEEAKSASVTAGQAPLTQSLGDAIPAEFLQAAQARENAEPEAAPAAAEAPEESVAQAAEPAEAPQAEAPKAEAPKAEAPKAEAPKAEAPKAEAPKAEAPKAEAPKAEAPKAEAPKAEAPKAPAPAQPVAPKPAAEAAPKPAQSAPRPAAAPKPVVPKPSVPKPGAPRPSSAAPKPSAPKPTAPRPSGRRGN
ncbi:Translation initiation factor IF-3 [Sinomonas atrocyanea]|uniref:Translation initiation factor IF-3 n=1 Tax=Sinomonas atrocyanea TaxID=37927 RepID=A0A126ZZ59_9MICC|nr:translation initiation factor IF-3 [Sinomonas atrocyanea]AMM32383.1 Translation initiation factor IF-3 [Sinomonas atrocyanea]